MIEPLIVFVAGTLVGIALAASLVALWFAGQAFRETRSLRVDLDEVDAALAEHLSTDPWYEAKSSSIDKEVV